MDDKESGIGKTLADAAASIAAYTALIYVAGWTYHYAYYTQFEAAWLLGLLSPRAILSSGGVSLATLTLLVVGHLIGVFKRPPTTPPFYKSKLRIALVLVGTACLATGIILLATDYGWGAVSYFVFPLLVLLNTVAVFGLALALRQSGAEVKRQMGWVTAAVILGIWLFPTSLGIAKGRTDRSKESSTLPQLELTAPTATAEYRALLITEERVYAVDLGERLSVIPLTWDQVSAVLKTPR